MLPASKFFQTLAASATAKLRSCFFHMILRSTCDMRGPFLRRIESRGFSAWHVLVSIDLESCNS